MRFDRRLQRLHLRLRHARMRGHLLPEVWRGMFWVALSGLVFCLLNTLVRAMTLTLDPFESQFLRYLFSVVAMVPLVLRQGWRGYIPVNMAGQWWRGGVHTLGLMFWATVVFMPLIVFYTGWAYRVMRGKVTAAYVQEHEHAAY